MVYGLIANENSIIRLGVCGGCCLVSKLLNAKMNVNVNEVQIRFHVYFFKRSS